MQFLVIEQGASTFTPTYPPCPGPVDSHTGTGEPGDW